MKLKFLQNISHCCNNKFAFHMHMFIILVLSLNKRNTTTHSNIRFMDITYNQNSHFIIHCKKFHKQDYNSFHRNMILQKIHTKDEHKIHCLFNQTFAFVCLIQTYTCCALHSLDLVRMNVFMTYCSNACSLIFLVIQSEVHPYCCCLQCSWSCVTQQVWMYCQLSTLGLIL